MLSQFHFENEEALIAGTDKLIELYPKQLDGTAINLTGYQVRAVIRDFLPIATIYPFQTTIVLPSKIMLGLTRAEIALIAPGEYEWFLELTDPSGLAERYIEGRLRRR